MGMAMASPAQRGRCGTGVWERDVAWAPAHPKLVQPSARLISVHAGSAITINPR